MGLEYLHKNGVVHRDVKPSNMLVTGSLQKIVVKISDFGDMSSLKETVTSTMITLHSMLNGTTISYLAHEILKNEVSNTNWSSDVYAFGISMFEILSNLKSPWESQFPILNDFILLEALKNNTKPESKLLKVIYDDSLCNELDQITVMLLS